MRILLVDASEKFLISLSSFIDSFPSVNIIGKTSNGKSALEMCSRLNPDLVMMDITLPGMSGFETAKMMKSLRNPPRIFALSFSDEPEYTVESINSEADGYLTKFEISSGLFRQISSIFSSNSGAASLN
ncbi:MAG TPA: response regulator transcription factor [Ignavibacteriaceae bacterium]|nr:response regulator transcription factor [Ignavibacteriaceae bacterium]